MKSYYYFYLKINKMNKFKNRKINKISSFQLKENKEKLKKIDFNLIYNIYNDALYIFYSSIILKCKL